MNILLLIVHYNNLKSTLDTLFSIRNLNMIPEIHLIDNASNKLKTLDYDELKGLTSEKLEIDALEQNYGYFGAVAKHLSNIKRTSYDWIFISNNDMIYDDEHLFDYVDVVKKMTDNRIGVYCPAIVTKSMGINQNPYLKNRPNKLFYYKLKLLLSNYFIAKFYEKLAEKQSYFFKPKYAQSNENNCLKKIFAPHGSFLGISKEYFKKGGYIENQNFLYFEEEIIGLICRKIGLSVIYDPRVSVMHCEHQTTGKKYSKLKHQIRKKSFQTFQRYYLER